MKKKLNPTKKETKAFDSASHRNTMTDEKWQQFGDRNRSREVTNCEIFKSLKNEYEKALKSERSSDFYSCGAGEASKDMDDIQNQTYSVIDSLFSISRAGFCMAAKLINTYYSRCFKGEELSKLNDYLKTKRFNPIDAEKVLPRLELHSPKTIKKFSFPFQIKPRKKISKAYKDKARGLKKKFTCLQSAYVCVRQASQIWSPIHYCDGDFSVFPSLLSFYAGHIQLFRSYQIMMMFMVDSGKKRGGKEKEGKYKISNDVAAKTREFIQSKINDQKSLNKRKTLSWSHKIIIEETKTYLEENHHIVVECRTLAKTFPKKSFK